MHTDRKILLVDDNPADVRLTQEAFAELGMKGSLLVAGNGEQALMLLREAQSSAAERPDLILLDLNLPGVSGHEVLAEIKQDARLRSIPVIVVSSSFGESDIRRSYEHHANCYVRKPDNLHELVELAADLVRFWFGRATLIS